MMVSESATVSGFILPGNHRSPVYAITYDAMYSESFRTDPESDLWIPFQFNLNSDNQLHSFGAAGRLKPGLSLAQANAQLRLASQAARRQGLLPDPHFAFVLEPLRDAIVRDARASLLFNAGFRGPRAADRLGERRESVAWSRYRSQA